MFPEVARLFVVILGTAVGFMVGRRLGGSTAEGLFPMVGCLVGYVGGGVFGRLIDRGIGVVEDRTRRIAPAEFVAIGVGSLGGGVGGGLIAVPIVALVAAPVGVVAAGLIVWVGVWVGVRVMSARSTEFLELLGLSSRPLIRARAFDARDGVLLDTSVIMDGQLLALARTGLLSGDVLVAGCVLDELQGWADARGDLRARRARSGLEAIEHVKDSGLARVFVLDDEVPEHDTVDAKLVALAERLELRLMTNDEPLARVAGLRGVPVVNVRRLLTDLAPAVTAGELLEVVLTRPGSEPDQGAGELDDGSLCIVNGGAHLVGLGAVVVAVRSVVPTARGRLVFAAPVPDGAPTEPDADATMSG